MKELLSASGKRRSFLKGMIAAVAASVGGVLSADSEPAKKKAAKKKAAKKKTA